MRDVLCNQIPVVFQDHYPYALCALCGCFGY
ncbi:MAG: TRIC cation channel family protein [Candidatus Contendobacter sp.]